MSPKIAPAQTGQFRRGRVVLFAGIGDSTDIVANYLSDRYADLVVIVEGPVDRIKMTRRRAQRIGWPAAIGQVLFVIAVLPLLERKGTRRKVDILRTARMADASFVPTYSVTSVNDPESTDLLRSLDPDVVVINGTRIIAAHILGSIACPVINMHAGITPQYRGVHGGYWALRDRHPDLVGTTIHLVDAGIDTGSILVQAHFGITEADSFATYPYLHLAAGLPALAEQVDRALSGATPEPCDLDATGTFPLRYQPTIWGYLWYRVAHGVR
jgi:Formyl transferase